MRPDAETRFTETYRLTVLLREAIEYWMDAQRRQADALDYHGPTFDTQAAQFAAFHDALRALIQRFQIPL